MGTGLRFASVLRFGSFDLDLRAGELHKKGIKIKLQDQPLQILTMLLQHPGEVVTREEIRQMLWPTDTFVDFDHGLNTAINRLRTALGDSAENPSFVETLPRRGYRFIGQLAGQGQPRSASEAPKDEKIRLAVLPLDDYSDDPGRDYFSDGMTEEMITQLGSMNPHKLGVIARTSVGQYKKTRKPISEIGQELNVDYVLEGSVRRSSGRVRISAQLIQVCDQTHIWAESYERDLRDVLMLQDEVARSIAREIRIALSHEEQVRFTRERHVDPEAYEAYLQGRHYWSRLSGNGWKRAQELFEKANARDPGYAPAIAGIADCCIKFGQFCFLPPHEAFPRARELALKAIAIDDMLPEARASLGMIRCFYDWDWPGADEEFRHAIRIGPHIAIIHAWYALCLMIMGRLKDSLQEIQAGLALEPFGNLTNTVMGMYYYTMRENDFALAQLGRAVDMHPDSFPARFLLGIAYLAKRQLAEAITAFQKARELSGNDYACAFLGVAYGRGGMHDKVLELFKELAEKSRHMYVPASVFASLHLALGQVDEMFGCLDKAFEERDSILLMLRMMPDYDPIRPHPRFQALLTRLNLP